MNTFNKLAPYIQEFVYNNNWTELRDVQVAACDVIFNTNCNLLLSAGTATGKTEAAFLPVLTMLYEKPSTSVGVLYVSPLKALINDQFARLDYLLKEGNISVCKWHGDAPNSAKNRLLKNPEGVLQITPESLESLMINKKRDCIKLFHDLRFIIIDEAHHFMANTRGIQLLCLLERIQKLAKCNPRRIGLSATLGDYSSAESWLCSGSSRKCKTPIVSAPKRRLNLSMQRFVSCDNVQKLKTDSNEKQEIVESEISRYYNYLYQKTLLKKTIIFAKSRTEVETIIAHLKNIAKRNNTPDIYRVHHGSISAVLREEAEKDIKLSDEQIVVGATVTLELGVDIGALDRIVQIGAPVSASSFTQRIGRAGRQGQTAELIFAFLDNINPENSGDSLDSINWEFIKTIAIIQLFLEEKWVEPITPLTHSYSLLYHQTMSHLVANGEVRPARLAQNILGLNPFQKISQEDYQLLLRYLIEIGHLQKTENGSLVVGYRAEPIVTNYQFYAVFETATEYEVKCKGESIGKVTGAYPVGAKFALAGRAWQTIDINQKNKTILVQEVSGISKTNWVSPSETDLHTKILKKMREILKSEENYAYLSQSCTERLQQLRSVAQNIGMLDNLIVPLDDERYAIFPWIGTKQLFTLFFALHQYKEIIDIVIYDKYIPIYIEVTYEDGEEALGKLLDRILNAKLDKYNFYLPDKIQISAKFNDFIPKKLLIKQFIEDYLDVDGLKRDVFKQ